MKNVILLLLFSAVGVFAAGGMDELLYTFTDRPIEFSVADIGTNKVGDIYAITELGITEPEKCNIVLKGAYADVLPVAEGINILKIGDKEYRFLAIAPPKKIDKSVVLKKLPLCGKKLLSGSRFVILSMGDSVTATGDYENMLKMLLERATGNRNIAVVDKSYPGRSIDASVRFFDRDTNVIKPDLGLIMYGLNDQACRCSLDGYLEQCEFLIEKLRKLGADALLLEPTPHIDIFKTSEEIEPRYPEYAFRTIGFAAALKSVAEKHQIPIAHTFNAIWIPGRDIYDSATKMMVFYPPHYSKQKQSMLENNLKGDTIHPNSLGHLMIAKAVFRAICGVESEPELKITGSSEWKDTEPVSELMVKNTARKPRKGYIQVYQRLESGRPKLVEEGEYELGAGELKSFLVQWPDIKHTDDLYKFPFVNSIAPGNPIISVVDYCDDKTEVYGVPAPFSSPKFVRERQVVTRNKVKVNITDGSSLVVDIPKGSQVGRIPLMQMKDEAIITAELAYVQFAQARPGDACVDAVLDEWADHHWSVIGEKCQARWVKGIQDFRARLDECYIKWAVKASTNGFFVACKIRGTIKNDNFIMFFDSRSPELLGTAGPYYWVAGKLSDNGLLDLKKGETSPSSVKPYGRWMEKGKNLYQLEFFIPYALLDSGRWPESGDLGLSFWWTHNSRAGKTHLQWSEDGHPWNTRWYGVARLTNNTENLPYVVRIK